MMASRTSEQVLPPCPDCLNDVTHKLLPTLFAILFIITGTVVLVYSLSEHQPVPSSFVTGVAITFGVLFALMLIGNFLLYARMRMRLMRSASGSERSMRIEGQREAWNIRLRKFCDECEDGPRRLIREFALRKAFKNNARKRSIADVNQDGYRNSDVNVDGTTPADRVAVHAELESREKLGGQMACEVLHDASRNSTESRRTRSARHVPNSTKTYTEASNTMGKGQQALMSSSINHRIWTDARGESLQDTNKISSLGQMLPPVDAKKVLTIGNKTTQSAIAENWLNRLPQLPRDRLRPGASREQHNSKIDPRTVSRHLTKGYDSESQLNTNRSSDFQVLRPNIVQHDTIQVSSQAPDIEKQNFNPYTRCFDSDSRSPVTVVDACQSRSSLVNRGLYETQTAKLPSSVGSVKECNSMESPVATDGRACDVHTAHNRHTDHYDSFTGCANTCRQESSVTSILAPKLAPNIPAMERGSCASGFKGRIMGSLSAALDADGEQYCMHSIAMTRQSETPDEGELPR